MRSEGSRFIWGSGGEAVFAESCVCVRNRPQPSATVRVSAVRLSTMASASGVVPNVCQVDLWRRSYIGVCRGGVCVNCVAAIILEFAEELSVSAICVAAVILAFVEEVSVSGSVQPPLYWRLQRTCLCESSVPPQFYWRLQRRCEWCRRSYVGDCRGRVCVSDLWRRSVGKACQVSASYKSVKQECRTRVSSKTCWRLQRTCLCEWSVPPQLYWRLQRSCRGGVCESDLWRRRVGKACQVRVSYKSVKQECRTRVSSKTCWRLQRTCLCEWAVSPQFYWRLQRRCLCERSVSQKSVK